MLSMVAHACHLSYEGSLNKRILIPADLGINVRPYLKRYQSEKELGHGSNDRVPV
jgi:hypothetical protein